MLRKKKIAQLTESELILLAQKNRKYFGVLYDNYFDQIFRFVFKRLGGLEEIAGDLTQQTFMKAMVNLSKYEDRGFPFSSWLYRIAQNEINLYFRQQKKEVSVPINENQLKDMAKEAEISRHMSSDDQKKLVEVMNKLKPEQLDLIELRFFQEMSFKQISEIYSITEANAKMRTYRILERIAKLWKEEK